MTTPSRRMRAQGGRDLWRGGLPLSRRIIPYCSQPLWVLSE
jgi:hypothetical protein